MLKRTTLERIQKANKIIIIFQLVFFVAGIIDFTFFLTSAGVLTFMFAPVFVYVLYNCIVQAMLDYKYFYTKYEYSLMNPFSDFLIMKKAKQNGDMLDYNIKLQKWIQALIVIFSTLVLFAILFIQSEPLE